jgi:hypothetical protein
MSYGEIYQILQNHNNNLERAARDIYNGDEDAALFVIKVGLERIAGMYRRKNRKKLTETVVNPTFPTGKYGKVPPPSKKARAILLRATESLLHSWKINANIYLGDATKEDLVMAANSERKSAIGKERRAMFYERLAAPMQEGETVTHYWKNDRAVQLIREEVWRVGEDDGRLAAE